MKISVVVNTFNEEKNIDRCLASVQDFADEIVVVDMHSSDKTVEIAKKFKAKVFQHEYTKYVEPARNFALSKASGEWILLLDADEELPDSLAKKLREIMEIDCADVVEIPRKNIIFEKWIEHSRWWPDYLVRFFRQGKVKFSKEIHVPPKTEGEGLTLDPKKEFAIIHHNFQTISQFIERLNRYSDIQADEIVNKGEKFDGMDLVTKPANEFFSRYFAGEGYKDGIHGLALSILQAVSEFVVYLKVWEIQGFENQNVKDFQKWSTNIQRDFFYWQQKISQNFFQKFYFWLKRKI